MGFTFVQMADPQFGMFESVSKLSEEEVLEKRHRGIALRFTYRTIVGCDQESTLFMQAVQKINILQPSFAVICGDMTDKIGSEEQLQELFHISSYLNTDIPLYWVPGNHDVGNVPDRQSLLTYRRIFGNDNYSFVVENCYFITMNSCVCFNPSKVPQELERLMAFLVRELESATSSGFEHKIIFTHHPLFLQTADEPNNYFSIPMGQRSQILQLLNQHRVSAVMSGHLHRNHYRWYGRTELISTSSIGYPLGNDPSGMRVVRVSEMNIDHQFIRLSNPKQEV